MGGGLSGAFLITLRQDTPDRRYADNSPVMEEQGGVGGGTANMIMPRAYYDYGKRWINPTTAPPREMFHEQVTQRCPLSPSRVVNIILWAR